MSAIRHSIPQFRPPGKHGPVTALLRRTPAASTRRLRTCQESFCSDPRIGFQTPPEWQTQLPAVSDDPAADVGFPGSPAARDPSASPSNKGTRSRRAMGSPGRDKSFPSRPLSAELAPSTGGSGRCGHLEPRLQSGAAQGGARGGERRPGPDAESPAFGVPPVEFRSRLTARREDGSDSSDRRCRTLGLEEGRWLHCGFVTSKSATGHLTDPRCLQARMALRPYPAPRLFLQQSGVELKVNSGPGPLWSAAGSPAPVNQPLSPLHATGRPNGFASYSEHAREVCQAGRPQECVPANVESEVRNVDTPF